MAALYRVFVLQVTAVVRGFYFGLIFTPILSENVLN